LGGKKAAIQWGYDKGKATGNINGGHEYNDLYPLTKPVSTEKGLRYRIGIISDLDVESKSAGGKWISYLRRGDLFLHFDDANPKLSKVPKTVYMKNDFRLGVFVFLLNFGLYVKGCNRMGKQGASCCQIRT